MACAIELCPLDFRSPSAWRLNMANFTLPLNLSNKRDMEAFFHAIDDPATRAGVSAAALPAGAAELIKMVDDQDFQNRAVPLGRKVLQYRREVASGMRAPDDQFTKTVIKEGADLKLDLTTRYPAAMQLLTQYGELQQGQMLAGINAGWAVANTEAVVNAAVWANVAAVTNVAVAAAAVAVVAAVVA